MAPGQGHMAGLRAPERERRDVLVGRRLELAAVEAALETAAGGASACLAVTGEPGIGKTALLRELRRRAGVRGLATADGRAGEAGREPPFAFLGDVLEQSLEHVRPDRLATLGDVRLADLGAIVPLLAPFGPPSTGLRRPHAAVLELLRLLTAAGPLIVMLDDLHWSDAASLDVVCRLLASPLPAGLVLVVAYRAGLLPAAAGGALAAAVRARRLAELALDPLGASETAQLLGPSVSEGSRAQIFREGAGNPFSILELARTPLAEGVPRSIVASVRAELERLPELARTVLRAAAVLDDPIEPELVGEVAGVGGEEVRAGLAALVDLDLVTAQGEPPAHRFRQPVLRRAVLALTPPGETLRMHARAAAELERRGGSLAARALHVSRAATRGDDAAIALLTEVGERCVYRAPVNAAQWFAAAARLLREDQRERRLDLLGRQASALAASGRLDDCRAVLLPAIDGAPAGDAVSRARLIGLLARVEHMRGEGDAARALLERAFAEIPEPEGPVACALRIELAVDRWPARDWGGIAPAAHGALEHARRLGDPAMEVEAAALLAGGEYFALSGERARSALDEAAYLLRRVPDDTLAGVLRATLCVGLVALGLERHQLAVDLARRGLTVASATAQDFWRAGLLALLAVAELHRGRLRVAGALADEAVAAATTVGVDQQLIWTHAVRGWVSLAQGDLTSATASAERAREALGRAAGSVAAGLPACIAGAALAEAGDPERAVAVIVGQAGGPELLALPPSSRDHWYGVLLRAELSQGRLDEAEEWLRRAEAVVDRLPLPARVGGLRLARAELRFALGDPQRAAVLASAASTSLRESGRSVDAARAELLTARADAALGRTSDARRRLVDARDRLAACGAHGLRQEAEHALLGLEHEPAGEGVLAHLTPRQRQVALLVTTGITNGEVAKGLGLSERTVERHVTRIFDRLRLSSRAALAAAVERSRRARAPVALTTPPATRAAKPPEKMTMVM
ncbi:MAG: helix-turn-helix transcriptional regulator [Solirubrobacteraceae bacterium]